MRERNNSSATPPSGSPRPAYTLFGSGQRNANRKGRGKKKPIDMTTIVQERFDIPTLNGGRVRTSLAELADEVLIKHALAGDPVSIREVFRRYDLEQDQAADRARKRRKKVSRRVWSRGLELMRIIIRNRLEPARETLEKLEAYGLVIRVNDKLVVPEWLRTTARIAARQVGDQAASG